MCSRSFPSKESRIEDCVALAKKVGREIWDRYQFPVYFYEAAAQRPERTNLENIRKGQFEGLREEVLTQSGPLRPMWASRDCIRRREQP